MADRLTLHRLRTDDPRMHLRAGDLLLCTPYRLDPDKVTVVCRITDGFDPQCNMYRVDLDPVTDPWQALADRATADAMIAEG